MIDRTREFRQILWMGYSIMYPYPPNICMASTAIFCAVSLQKSNLVVAEIRHRLPEHLLFFGQIEVYRSPPREKL